MSRRETYLESARAANDKALEQPTERPRCQVDSGQLNAIASELQSIRATVAQLERSLQALAPPSKPLERPRERRSRIQRPFTWVLAGALVTILTMTGRPNSSDSANA